MAWETKTFHFECRGCNELTQAEAKKCPTWCGDCRAMRIRFLSLIGTNRNCPRKQCNGCGAYMSNFDYGNDRFCADCTLVRKRRHDGWADPYAAKPRYLNAANDNKPGHKICTMCECDLPFGAFTKTTKGLSGYSSECRECRAVIRAERGREAEYERQRALRYDPVREAEKAADAVRRRRVRLCDKWNARRVREAKVSRALIGGYLDGFYAKQEKSARLAEKLQAKPWLAPGLTLYERHKIRVANDNDFAVNDRLRRRLAEQVRLRKRGRCGEAAKAVRRAIRGAGSLPKFFGYSADELRTHLESLFTDGMTWDAFRRGDIHVDHKTPLAHFDLTDNDQVREAWAITNLQPLWAADNIAKGAMTDEEWRAVA